MSVCINHISIYLPDNRLSNADLANVFDIEPEQLFKNTHINARYVSKAGELSSCLTIGNRSNRSRRARFLSIYMLFVKLAKFKIVEAVAITANVLSRPSRYES